MESSVENRCSNCKWWKSKSSIGICLYSLKYNPKYPRLTYWCDSCVAFTPKEVKR